MIIVESSTRTNFIDENDVFVGFDTYQNCCEHAGWFISDEHEAYVDGYSTTKVRPNTVEGIRDFDVTGYALDTSGPEDIEGNDIYEGTQLEFRLTKEGSKDLFLNIFNAQNGYYSHEVFIKAGEADEIRITI